MGALLKFERIDEKDDKHYDKGVDGEGLDHRETDDERRRDLSGYARIPCDTFACLAETDALTDSCPERSQSYRETAAERSKGIVVNLGTGGSCRGFLSKRKGCQEPDHGQSENGNRYKSSHRYSSFLREFSNVHLRPLLPNRAR